MNQNRETSPLVSVIIPTYNRAHLLGRSIQSVLDQTYRNIEVIVVDDASTDDTLKVVNSFSDKRIRYIKNETNLGGAAARNIGIKVAKGEYVAFQDSDDEWLPAKLWKQMAIFETASAETGVVYTGFWRISNGQKTYIPANKIKKKEGKIYLELMKGNFVSTQTVVVRKECLKKSGLFDERLPRLQDWELFLRISREYEFSYVAEPLVIAYFTPDSISAKKSALIEAKKIILEKHRKEFANNKQQFALMVYSIGSLLCQDGQMKDGRNYLFTAYKINKSFIKALFAIILSFLGRDVFNCVKRLYHKFSINRFFSTHFL